MSKLGLFSNIHNSVNQIRKAVQFHQFSLKLLQMRKAEAMASLMGPARFYASPPLPRDLIIRVTERCFLDCGMCGQNGESARVDRSAHQENMDVANVLRKITNEITQWPVKPFVKLTGGEPLVMRDSLLDVIQEMRERGLVVKMNTNGMLLKFDKIAERVAETDLNYLSISLDGGKEVQNKLRNNDKLFDDMMEGIAKVQHYRKELGKNNLMILISMTVSSETYDQIEEVYRICVDKKIDWFNVQFLNFTTDATCDEAEEHYKTKFGITNAAYRGFNNPRFNDIKPETVANQIQNILCQKASVPISVMNGMVSVEEIEKYYFTTDLIRKKLCHKPFTGMHIVQPGKAVFCIDYPFFDYGDIRENTLEEIWYGKQAQAFRVDMVDYYQDKNKNLPQCQRCNWRFN